MSFWGKKKFINSTPMAISVQLWVRKGGDPGSTKSIKNFSLNPHHGCMESYGDDANPFLDGISINGVDQGETIAEQQFVFQRGNALDNGFNTNDTVTVRMIEQNFVLEFSNTWT